MLLLYMAKQAKDEINKPVMRLFTLKV